MRGLRKWHDERRWARDYEAGYQHGAAWLLRGGAVAELLAQRQRPELFCEFDRGINCAVAAYRQLTGTKPRPAPGVNRPLGARVLVAPASVELKLEAA